MTSSHHDAEARPPVAIVTGGSGCTGRQIVQRLAAGGHAVVVGYLRDQLAADAVVDDVLARRGAALAVRGDVADELDVERLFSETARAFGGVDVVVHAASGPSECVGRAAAARAVREGGAIVNVVGDASDTSASVLARRLAGRHVSVNAVVGRGVRASVTAVADAVVYLVSDDGRGVTGQVIEVPDAVG